MIKEDLLKMKVMGNRTLLTPSYAVNCPNRLMVFDADTLEPVEASWTYSGESNSTTSTTFLDNYPNKELIVSSAGYQSVTVRSLNISNCAYYGNISGVPTNAMFVVKDNNTISKWGPSASQYPFPDENNYDISNLYTGVKAMSALRRDNTIFAWGDPFVGGMLKPSDLERNDVRDIRMEFGMGMLLGKNIPTVSQWGSYGTGSNDVPDNIASLENITKILTNGSTQVALTDTGTIYTWGVSTVMVLPDEIAALNDIKDVCINSASALALRENGQVVAWGKAYDGGVLPERVSALSDIHTIISTPISFVALREDKTLMFWGQNCWQSSAAETLTNIEYVKSTDDSIHIAIDSSGAIYLWNDYGDLIPAPPISDVVSLTSSYGSFAALKKDGSVIVWGTGQGADISEVSDLLSDILAIYPTYDGFIALKEDKTLIAWGNSSYQEDNASIPVEVQGNVTYQY